MRLSILTVAVDSRFPVLYHQVGRRGPDNLFRFLWAVPVRLFVVNLDSRKVRGALGQPMDVSASFRHLPRH